MYETSDPQDVVNFSSLEFHVPGLICVTSHKYQYLSSNHFYCMYVILLDLSRHNSTA